MTFVFHDLSVLPLPSPLNPSPLAPSLPPFPPSLPPQFTQDSPPDHAAITLRMCLEHTAGFPADPDPPINGKLKGLVCSNIIYIYEYIW